MATSNQTIDITNDRAKRCSRCEKCKKLDDFIRLSKNDLKEFSSCNACAEKRKKKRSESVSDGSELININSSSSNVAEDNRDEMNIDVENEALYDLVDLEDLISNCFTNVEENKQVLFSGTFTFENDLVTLSCDNQETDEESKYRSLVRSFLPAIETGSRYYWEIRKIYLHTKNKQYTGEATAYLGCAQRDNRKSTGPDERPSKRISEARPAIDRYPCGGNITINININKCQATIDIEHLMAHEYPTYRENNIPQNAIAWISRNVNRGFRKIEFYKRLREEKLINPTVHTYQQVYYWALKFSAQQYVTNVSNQLLSSRNFLEQQELTDQGYKVIFYLENDFVRALGFTTPFLRRIQTNNISEIIVDSTFKTNQENFEVFAVINNCGGYGVPFAYLYVSTMAASSERLHDLTNNINTRVKVLKEFFSLLRADGVLPSFILLDKDAGEIAAAEEAWSWTASIQICLWHVEHAVERKLREKRQKMSQYTSQVANDAKQQFEFIDEHWIPNGQANDLCAEGDIQDILKMIKRHSVLHPLIPINEGTFLTSDDIYRQSVREAYNYCKQKNLVYLWGYLWINWYKKNWWNLFG
ncbi:3239_t:CDS:1 [Paraglomus occultum]|uniref:3239_t:CDS:1 n=1 Tax=Paraglomus occultum TaxID=144539 RepID=A0A9N9AQZ3_9GLOM|nr:3239_t:CDS:1 [Paraglomus occultum]